MAFQTALLEGQLREAKKDIENLQLKLEISAKEKQDLQDYQGLVVMRGLVEKAETVFFKNRRQYTQRERWQMIATNSEYADLRRLLDECNILDLPAFVHNATRNASGLVHNMNLVKKCEAPSFFGPNHRCMFEKLRQFCESRQIEMNNSKFLIDAYKAIHEDMERFWEEEGKVIL